MADIKNIKVVDAEQLNADLFEIAEAIRTKGGTGADLLFPDGFVAAVDKLKTEFKTQEKTATPSQAIQTIEPDSGYDGLKSVTVDAISSNYIVPSETINVYENTTSSLDITNGKWLNVAVDVPEEYVKKSLLRGAVYYFDVSSNKTGVSNVDSSWESFTPAFRPKFIVFAQSENSNGSITRISSSAYTLVFSWWFDNTLIDNPRHWGKGGMLYASSTPTFNVSSNGTGIRYDATKNKIFFNCTASNYGLRAGTNSNSSVQGYYMVQYWG